MPLTILLHLTGEDPMVAEIDKMPEAADQFLACQNPRRRDGTDVKYLDPDIKTLLLPWHRIHSIEIMGAEGEEEEIFTFVRE
ncbi:MAG: hypothetical protein JXD18_13825 [Anaerolineae bacterium]|nr:hypothetical protein [Anaerolineae bacterium]